MTELFRIFVAGTDFNCGKTEAAAALLSLLADEQLSPAPFKPYEGNCVRLAAPQDALALQAAARSVDALELICPHRFSPSTSPGTADPRDTPGASFNRTLDAFASFRGRPLVAEGMGGLREPLDPSRDVIDLIVALGLDVLLVAPLSSGTLNQVGLSIDALVGRRVNVRAVLLTRTTPSRDLSTKDVVSVLESRHDVRILAPVRHLLDPIARRRAFRRALLPLLPRPRLIGASPVSSQQATTYSPRPGLR